MLLFNTYWWIDNDKLITFITIIKICHSTFVLTVCYQWVGGQWHFQIHTYFVIIETKILNFAWKHIWNFFFKCSLTEVSINWRRNSKRPCIVIIVSSMNIITTMNIVTTVNLGTTMNIITTFNIVTTVNLVTTMNIVTAFFKLSKPRFVRYW